MGAHQSDNHIQAPDGFYTLSGACVFIQKEFILFQNAKVLGFRKYILCVLRNLACSL